MARDWSNLNHDLLRLIAAKVRKLEDFTRLWAVCSNWITVLSRKEERLIFNRTQLPWLMLPCGHDHPCQLECRTRRAFSMMENKVHHLNFQDAYGKKCVGSSHGWLVMVEDVSPAIFMLNPLTKQRIELPPVTTMPEIEDFSKEDVGREYTCKNICGGGIERMSLKDIEDFFTVKIILSNDPQEEDCIAVALCGPLSRLVFCRIGDNKWTEVEHDLKPPQSDVIYSKGKFYVVNSDGRVGFFDIRNPQVTIIHEPPYGINTCCAVFLAVDPTGALLLISRWVDLPDVEDDNDENDDDNDNNDEDDYYNNDDNAFNNTYYYLTKEFNVYKMDDEKSEWNKVRDIGENMLFLGENQSVCYSTIEFPEFQRNTIYFTDGQSQGGIYRGHDVGIFNIEDGLIRKVPCFNEDEALKTNFPPPVWFTPSIRPSSI